MQKTIFLLSLCLSSLATASAPSVAKKVIAHATIENFHTDYSITLASGYCYKVKSGKRVDPQTNEPIVMRPYSYQTPAVPDRDFAQAIRLFDGHVAMKAIATIKLSKKEYAQEERNKTLRASQWQVFEDETVEQAS